MLLRSVEDLRDEAEQHGRELNVKALAAAEEAQEGPSYYGAFNMLWEGQPLSDHHRSRARFRSLRIRVVPGKGRTGMEP